MGSFVENVNKVASLIPANVEDLNLIVQNIDAINAVAPLANDLNDIIDNIVPNLTEILEADNNATIATEQALLATTNKDASESARDIAITKAVEATTKAGEASTSASNALASEVQAGVYASQLDPSKIVAKDSPTGSAMMPAGTTAQRPISPSNGYMRYNNDLSKFEGYQGGVWSTLGGLDINTLTAKATPIDADEMVLADSASSFSLKKFTLSNLKTVLDLTWTANDTRAKTALNASGTAPIYACRAWVNFNGTGTVAIRASGNVSSITDNGVGDYTVNFTTAMPDVNYCIPCGSGDVTPTTADDCAVVRTFARNLSNISVYTGSSSSTGNMVKADYTDISISIVR